MTEPRLLFVEQARAVVGFVESAWGRLYPRWRASDGAESLRQDDIKDTLGAVREHSLTFLIAWGAVCGVPEAKVRELVRRLEAEAVKARLGGSAP